MRSDEPGLTADFATEQGLYAAKIDVARPFDASLVGHVSLEIVRRVCLRMSVK